MMRGIFLKLYFYQRLRYFLEAFHKLRTDYQFLS
jgi:hypothetical protein